VEWSYNVSVQIQSPLAAKPVSILFKHGGLHPRFHEDYIAFYGSRGAIYIKGHYGSGPLFLFADQKWNEIQLPADIVANIPKAEGDTERNWRFLIREFLNDIQGETHSPYQTFAHGAHYQHLIDIIRENESWIYVRDITESPDK